MNDLTLHFMTEKLCDCGASLGIYFVQGGRILQCSSQTCMKYYGKVERLTNQEFKMPFGKYKGIVVSELPRDYLEWGAKSLAKNIAARFQEELQNGRA